MMGALTREAQREQYIDFNYVPFHIALTTVALIKPDLIDITVGPFFRPFKLEVWGCILAAIPIIGVALLLFARACGAAAPKRHKQELQSTTDALWFSVGALLQQGEATITGRDVGAGNLFFALGSRNPVVARAKLHLRRLFKKGYLIRVILLKNNVDH